MEIHQHSIDYLEFCLVLIFLIFPPLFNKQSESNQLLSYEIIPLVFYLCVSFYLFFRTKTQLDNEITDRFKKKFLSTILFCIVSLGLLFLSSFVFSLFESSKTINLYQKPTAPYQCVNIIIGIMVFAFFEEVLFRQYLPFRLKQLTINKLSNKFYFIITEVIPVIMFAILHYQNGVFSVLHAFVSGIILRLLLKLNKSILYPFIIHSIFNLISVYLLIQW